MKLEINTNNILGVIEKASKATGKNLTLPVLSCLYLEADSNSGVLRIKSTNLDIGSEFSVKANCLESGSIAVPANVFLNLISSIKNNQSVKIYSENGNMVVESKNNSSVIKCFPVEDFPTIPEVSKESKVTIKSNDFVYGVKSVWYSASVSSIKPELASIFIYPEDQSLVFVATDSFRLAEKKVHYKKSVDFQPILIPYNNIIDIVKIIESYNDETTLYFDKNQIGFYFEDGFVVSRVVEGSFPDYKQIIPKESKTDIDILKNDLVKTIKSSQIFSDPLNQIKFKIGKNEKNVEVTVKNNDVGEYKEVVPAKVSGDDLEISFNHKYILDCVQSIDSDSLNLSFSGMGRPMVIKGIGDNSFLYIVMPMNR